MAMLASSLVTTTKRVGHLGCGHVMQSGSQCRGAEATSQLVTTNDLILVMVAFSSRARILGECSTIHSTPAIFFLKWRLARAN